MNSHDAALLGIGSRMASPAPEAGSPACRPWMCGLVMLQNPLMGKDIKARVHSRMTLGAIANLIAAIVEAMREADVDNLTIHSFLDRLDRLNIIGLDGPPLEMLIDIVEIVRRTVPSND